VNLRSFQALTFDCYGTLIDWERGITDALRPWADRHSLDADDEAILTLYAESEAREEATAPGKRYPEVLMAVFRDIARQIGCGVSPEELEAFSLSVCDWPAFPDSADALRYLEQHHRLVIVSNVDRASFEHSKEKLGVSFDLVVTAEDVGSYKPHPRHFNVALGRLREMGVERRGVLHVAQSLYHDHVPAKSLGLQTVWINRRAGKTGTGATPRVDLDIQPDLVVNDMADLVAIHQAEGM